MQLSSAQPLHRYKIGRSSVMEFKQLQSFVEVVKHQSFTKAAEKTFVSQPTISAHISQLEEELNKRLILRTTKSIELTPKGKEVYDLAVRILGMRDRLLESCNPKMQKIIHIGASTIPSAYILPSLLPEYGNLNNDTYFSIHQNDSQGIVDGLKEGLFDIGMIGMKVEDEKVTCIPFCEDHMLLITPVNDHFLQIAQDKSFDVKTLLKEPIIMRESGSGSKKTADLFLERLHVAEEDINIVARVNDQEAIKNMVASGLGVSIISEMAAKNFLEERRILSFPLDSKASNRQLYLIYRKDFLLPDYVQKFLKFIQSKY